MMKQVNIRRIPVRLLALIAGLFLTVGAFAQIDVRGHVKDSSGEPIIGATIRVVGQSLGGVVSDFDGNFTLKANQGTTLEISYVGYQTARVTAAANIVVTLQDDAQVLENVVVIGYGRAKKSDLTGSVTAIKPDDMNHGLQTNAQDMLQGKIAGVNVTSLSGEPGASAQIRIRGGSSLNASNDPLIVIDGLALDNKGIKGSPNGLAMVNPNDIESFTVLKDASATAIYGSRASNGVIIITTKKGRAGQKARVTYSGNVSIATPKNLLDVMDGDEYRTFIGNLYGTNSKAYKSLGWYDQKKTGTPTPTYKDGKLSGFKDYYSDGTQHFANTDWQDEIYRTAVSSDHNLTVTGGLKNMPYRVSIGATSNNGIVKTSNFTRYTASVNIAPTLLDDHLKFNINAKGMYSESRYADGGAVGAARWMDPTKPIKATQNDIYKEYFGGYAQWISDAAFIDPTWTKTVNSQATKNPVALLEQKSDKARSRSFIGNIEADYAIHGFEDLHIHMNAGVDYSTGKQTTRYDRNTAYGNDNYFGYDGWSDQDKYNLSFNAYLQYQKDLGDAHHFDVMAGYEYQRFHQETDWDSFQYYPMTSQKTAEEEQADGTKKDVNLAGTRYNAPEGVTKYKTENYLVSFFGRLNYSLLDRYMLTFTLRDDGSSRFAKGNRWGLFPSAALAWKMKEESFLKNVKALTDAKLRLGWGITGQQEGISDYSYISTYTPSNGAHAYYDLGLNGGVTYRPDAYNTDLTWEKTTTYNAGIDLAFLNNRIEFSVDWYYRKTTDLLNSVYVAAGSNFRNKVMSNIGSLHNTGIEFATTVRPVQTKDWNWEVSYNMTYNQNKIDELNVGGAGRPVETGGISGGTGNTIQAHAVDHAASAFYVYQQIYNPDGTIVPNTFVDRDGNGIINSDDRYFYYKPMADVTMGFSSKVMYRNWDLGFTMRASLGNYVYNNNLSGAANTGTGAIYTLGYVGNRSIDAVNLHLDNVSIEQQMSDFFVENASFLKLDNITLGYSFAKIFDANISGRVYATVQNVLTWTKYSGIDPEVAGGIDNSMYPRPFTTVLGVNLNF